MSYWTTQLLTGHGSFAKFLHRIGRYATPECRFCDMDEDDAEHTLSVCPAWTVPRRMLEREIGGPLNLDRVIGAMSTSKAAWKAFEIYAKEVMMTKEIAERQTEKIPRPRRRRL